jgi:hypothetical protein
MLHEQPHLFIAWLEQAGISHTLSVPITYTLIIFAVFFTALLTT